MCSSKAVAIAAEPLRVCRAHMTAAWLRTALTCAWQHAMYNHFPKCAARMCSTYSCCAACLCRSEQLAASAVRPHPQICYARARRAWLLRGLALQQCAACSIWPCKRSATLASLSACAACVAAAWLGAAVVSSLELLQLLVAEERRLQRRRHVPCSHTNK